MSAKKVGIYIGCVLLLTVCAVSSGFGVRYIIKNTQETASADIVHTSTSALSLYEDTLASKKAHMDTKQKVVVSVSENELQSDTEINSDNTPAADTKQESLPNVVQSDDGSYAYIIQQGDTLSKISAELLYSVDELANHNQIRDVNRIYAESALRIPVDATE